MFLTILILIVSAFSIAWGANIASRAGIYPDNTTRIVAVLFSIALIAFGLWGAHVAFN